MPITIPEHVRLLIAQSAEECRMALATCSDGVPNVIPVGFARVDGCRVILADFYFTKTIANILRNPEVALSCWETSKYEGYQLKGTIEMDYGEVFAEVSTRYEKKPYHPKGAAVLTVREIYDLRPGKLGRLLLGAES